MVDIYIQNPEFDETFENGIIDESNSLLIYIQQIKNVLFVENNVMGAVEMKIDLDSYVFETKISKKELESKIYDGIYNFCSLHDLFETILEVNFYKGEIRDICVVDIYINNIKQLEVRIK